ncbi:kinase [Synechocystis sp. PCC 7509]|uniref:kinase n=1 Tax=Synechocystis sp. PCC 7509 TaxID=927677 RepID=UPI0002ACF029|nr:kinase [Synechocystis sp. PCC 7509]
MDLWLEQILTNSRSLLFDAAWAKAFGITPETGEYAPIFRFIYPVCSQFNQQTLKLPEDKFATNLWTWWLPLAMLIAEYRTRQSKPLIQGILAAQGTGKSTLAAILKLILGEMGYRTICLSLDDLYKTYRDRLILQQQDPRLVWRGPPGTHDLDLGLKVLEALHQVNSDAIIQLPRFDKSAFNGAGDRGNSEAITRADIILFEGWFVGVRLIDPVVFDTAPPPIVTDSDRQFARDMNAKLQDYLPLWEQIDRLILLYPLDYRWSLGWRQQAEHQAIALGKKGMSDEELEQFVNYFWRSLHPELFIKPSIWVDVVIEINSDRSWGRIY